MDCVSTAERMPDGSTVLRERYADGRVRCVILPPLWHVDPSPEMAAMRRDPPAAPPIRHGMRTARLDPVTRERVEDRLDREGI